jgi:cytochrome c biogenesis protein
MKIRLQWLGSTRFTLVGMALLGIGAALSYDNPVTTPIWVLVIPLFLLALNLLIAIISNPAINRRFGLLMFHTGLLTVVILVAIGRLTSMEGHIELVDGAAFDPAAVFDVRKGPLHRDRLEQIRFIQQNYKVEYRPGMKRGLTHNQILLAGDDGRLVPREIGDDRPLLIEGYRIYSTSNKGFAPRLTWKGDDGTVESGSIHMPSYPLLYFRQANEWTPPGGETVKFWLQLETGLDKDNAWVLDPRRATGVLVVNSGGTRTELHPGQSVRLKGGTLQYQRLSSWMGFKVFYDPTLPWLFVSAILAAIGLLIHYWQKFSAEPLLLDADSKDRSLQLPDRGNIA